jgi:hypothetical protein
MKPFLIVYSEIKTMVHEIELTQFRKMFPSYESAREWALLTAQTSNFLKNLEMNIRVSQITQTELIYYNGQE